MNGLLSAIKAFVLKNRPAYKDYLGNGKYDIKKLPEECVPDSVNNNIKNAKSKADSAYSKANAAKNTANDAWSTPNDAWSTANALKENPVFTGSFSQNRKEFTQVGDCSHAEGSDTTASGWYSHAEGYYTKASGRYSHVQGKYNIDDLNEKYAHIVGNGTSDTARSNAHTLDWEGNAWFAGTVEGTAMIVKSSTPNSTKKFKITVDDTGTISAMEVT